MEDNGSEVTPFGTVKLIGDVIICTEMHTKGSYELGNDSSFRYKAGKFLEGKGKLKSFKVLTYITINIKTKKVKLHVTALPEPTKWLVLGYNQTVSLVHQGKTLAMQPKQAMKDGRPHSCRFFVL